MQFDIECRHHLFLGDFLLLAAPQLGFDTGRADEGFIDDFRIKQILLVDKNGLFARVVLEIFPFFLAEGIEQQ